MLDVLVIGGGNAALCAALMAREAGASVLVLESAPREWRGGNSVHTRNLRCMHDAPQDVLTEAYPEEEFWQDLLKVTGGLTTESMARLAIRESSSCRGWMRQHGVRFQPSLSGTLQLSRTNAFFMGGGKALMNAYYRSAEQLGIEVRYEAEVERLELDAGRFIAAHVNGPAGAQRIGKTAHRGERVAHFPRGRIAGPQRGMPGGAFFGLVDAFAGEKRGDAVRQIVLEGQLHQQIARFRSDQVF